MSEYTSVLVCLRHERTEVYMDGLPITEVVDGKLTVKTKRRDYREIVQSLRETIDAINCSEIAIMETDVLANQPK